MRTTVYLKTLRTALIILFVTMLILFSSIIANAGNTISLRLTNKVSGSGVGASYCPEIVLGSGRSTISFGANIQKRLTNLSGFSSEYQFTPSQKKERLKVFFYADMQYHNSALLSKSSLRMEERVAKDFTNNFSTVKLKVIETYAGFGLSIAHTSNLSSQFSIGAGMYTTLDNNYNSKNLYREQSALVLQLKWSVTYTLFNNSYKKDNKSNSQRAVLNFSGNGL